MNVLYHGDRSQIENTLFYLFETLTKPLRKNKEQEVTIKSGDSGRSQNLDYAVLDLKQYKLEKDDLKQMSQFITSLAESKENREDQNICLSDNPVSVLLNIIRQSYLRVDSHHKQTEKNTINWEGDSMYQPVSDVEFIQPMQSRIKLP